MSEKKSFLSTTAGTVTAIAALVTAVGGAVPVIMAVRGDNGSNPAATSSPTPTASPSETSPSTIPGDGEQPGGPDAAAAPPLIASPKSLDFGKVAPALSAATQAVQLVNTGQDAVTVERIRIVGPAASSFTLGESTCTEGTELAPDAACDLKVQFAPSGSGSQQATLVVDRTPGDPVEILLSGTASLL